MQTAKLVKQPRPNYPALAKFARIQGVVKLHALISKEGAIENLTVISGHPLLVPAALEAVKHWVYLQRRHVFRLVVRVHPAGECGSYALHWSSLRRALATLLIA